MISKSYTLDELCIFIRNGKSVKQSKDVDGLPITRIETIANQTIDSDRVGYAGLTEEEGKSHLLECGDILFSHINSLEHLCKTAIYTGFPEKLVHGMNLLCIRPNLQLIFPQYLLHLLRSSRIRTSLLQFANKSVNQASISAGNLKSFVVNIPPLAEQRRIASILDQADELRQKRQQAIEKLDQLLQATFIDMFGDPVSNPKGWQIEPLKNNILHANNGLSRRRKELENVGDIVLRLQDVHYDGIHFDKELNRISLDDSEKKRFSVDEGDILFIRVNGNPEYVGRSAVFSGYKEPIFHNDHLIRIKLSERYIPNFLSYCFNTPQGKNIISKQIKTSAGQHTVSQGGIEIMKFYIPPIKLQEQWTNLYLKIEDQKKKLNEQLDMQNQLFSSLQNQAFNGTL